ncbi:hypothetical protein [Bradyrhizobium sp. LHD-71]|uniref:hypothetical protein n=1 Tax=Bradyrhizobium sp. LHD-71 TaxID=3072141 RepID=UPI00280DC1BA|nr:hypothetical protein [Bradyrhizobium sp. LHD-71]MDQ8727651.1 hypothetical protein [Bradyrhizobium sp. LHD-71]
MPLSRRKFILAATGGVVALGAGAIVSWPDRLDSIRARLEHMLGKVPITTTELGLFAEAFERSWQPYGSKIMLVDTIDLAGLTNSAISIGPAPLATYIERYERKLLAEFVTRTDYYDAVAAGREVTFVPGDACQNPFAKFDSG